MEAKKSSKSATKTDYPDRLLIEYPKEKLKALKQYCHKKDICLEKKGVEFLDALYVKVVPKEVRAYIESEVETKEKG